MPHMSESQRHLAFCRGEWPACVEEAHLRSTDVLKEVVGTLEKFLAGLAGQR